MAGNSIHSWLFATERVAFRPWEMADLPSFFDLYGDPDVTRHLGMSNLASIDEARELFVKMRERYREWPAGMGGFPLIERKSGEVLGAVLVKPVPGADGHDSGQVEIGWHLRKKHWGKGFATEGGRAVRDYSFSKLDLHEVLALVEPDNAPSIAVVRRMGMTALGRSRAYYSGEELEVFVAKA